MAKVSMQRFRREGTRGMYAGGAEFGAPPQILDDMGRGLSSGIPEVAASGRKS